VAGGAHRGGRVSAVFLGGGLLLADGNGSWNPEGWGSDVDDSPARPLQLSTARTRAPFPGPKNRGRWLAGQGQRNERARENRS